jgi:metal-sulfur cluster biosynthetic enzyme
MMIETLSPSAVLEVLRPVEDPELRKSLVALNMIRNVKIDSLLWTTAIGQSAPSPVSRK